MDIFLATEGLIDDKMLKKPKTWHFYLKIPQAKRHSHF